MKLVICFSHSPHMILALIMAVGTCLADRCVVPPGTPGVTPDGIYATWLTAATNISDAIFVAGAGETLWVSNGHYRLTNHVQVYRSVTIRGFNDARDAVIIDGDYPNNTSRCFYVTAANAGLASMTITNGYVPGAGYGGGIWLNAAGNFISNCVVTGNKSEQYGGGVVTYNYADYVIRDSIIRGNQCLTNTSDAQGAGVYMRRGRLLMTNCVIRDNLITNGTSGGGSGGGLYYTTGATGTIWDCDFINNHAVGNGGGGVGIKGVFVNCNFISNTAGYNGGLNGAAEARDCVFAHNRSTFRWGGGLGVSYGGTSLISNCVFYSNSCMYSYGGGIYVGYQTAEIVDCIFSNNVCDDGAAGAGGGGGLGVLNATGMVRNCTFVDNRVLGVNNFGGGGLYGFGNTAVTAVNCRFEGNMAQRGGAAYVTNALFKNCLFAGNTGTNSGGAIHMLGNVRGFNCTFAGNTNILAGCAAVAATNAGNLLVSCIVQSNPNLATGGVSNHQNSAYVSFTNSCTLPLPAFGAGNNDADPQFANPASGDYRLAPGSPCRDAGINQDWMIPPGEGCLDLDGRPRIDRIVRRVDMGCYEHLPQGTMYGIR